MNEKRPSFSIQGVQNTPSEFIFNYVNTGLTNIGQCSDRAIVEAIPEFLGQLIALLLVAQW